MEYEPQPTNPARLDCLLCKGRGWKYVNNRARTCQCRYEKVIQSIRVSQCSCKAMHPDLNCPLMTLVEAEEVRQRFNDKMGYAKEAEEPEIQA